MQLIKLSLENWRNIAAREVSFDAGVTLVEGPNEIGKSTLVEALYMLFNEMDSSNKKGVKSIQPVGEDVGSRVEVEIETGDYRFIYSKQYNKVKATILNVTSPQTFQLTGREAHEKVEAILDETMDKALWDALLVDQGKKIAQAHLKDSEGLSKSLDEAAGSAKTGYEDSRLLDSVQSEYGIYFTPTGMPKNKKPGERFSQAEIALKEAKAALDEIENDAIDHEKCAAEATRLTKTVPELVVKLSEHEKKWNHISSLQNQVSAKKKELEDARKILIAAQVTHQQREELVEDIRSSEDKVKSTVERLTPLKELVDGLAKKSERSQQALTAAKNESKASRTAQTLAIDDQDYFQNLDQKGKEEDRLSTLKNITSEKAKTIEVLGSIKIDESGLKKLRDADNQLQIISGKREMAATKVEISAENQLDLSIGDKEITLEKTGIEELEIASETRLIFPGVASILIKPPKSAGELDEEVEECRAEHDSLLQEYEVTSFAEAVTANEKRADSQRILDGLKRREAELLQESSVDEIELLARDLKNKCEAYINQRAPHPELPKDLAESQDRGRAQNVKVTDADQILESAQEEANQLQMNFSAKESDLRLAQQEKLGLEEALNDNRLKLKNNRDNESDEVLKERVANQSAKTQKIESKLNRLESDLADTSPDAAQAQLDNARLAQSRAARELQEAEKEQAVLADRLNKAQANGKYESLEIAEREYEESEAEFTASQRRSEAVDLLWTTLNNYRDTTRKAYVRPLKDRIVQLGKIVFGSGFDIEIDGDWSISSRTLNGKNIPFAELSIGAKEQLGILTRLAAAQIVSKQGGVPLIIDDALGFSDPSRLETMGAAIAHAGKECQIILMTCTPGRFTHVGNAKLVKF